ncbi:hypothetical protein SDC9_196331 [bioreactor metagenome]|uniref:Transporter-associated domain-containing protein n=1 Tax=bioreactor metagenome TaxID=1076179 RepID=A0A645IE42_9ZZZZ
MLGIQFPEGDYETVAGYIMDVLGRIPGEEEHPSVTLENVTFTVMEMEDRRIGRVHVEIVRPAGTESGVADKQREKDE